MKVNIVFATKAKRQLLNVCHKQFFSIYLYKYETFYHKQQKFRSIRKSSQVESAENQEKKKYVRMQENLGIQGFHQNAGESFEPYTQTVTDTIAKKCIEALQ